VILWTCTKVRFRRTKVTDALSKTIRTFVTVLVTHTTNIALVSKVTNVAVAVLPFHHCRIQYQLYHAEFLFAIFTFTSKVIKVLAVILVTVSKQGSNADNLYVVAVVTFATAVTSIVTVTRTHYMFFTQRIFPV
jgi:hypothetical protein